MQAKLHLPNKLVKGDRFKVDNCDGWYVVVSDPQLTAHRERERWNFMVTRTDCGTSINFEMPFALWSNRRIAIEGLS